MTTKIVFVAICMVAAGVSPCFAQATDLQTITNWGNSVQGVQLAITTTNNVFSIGTSSAVMSVTRNSSTNAVLVALSVPTINFDVLLVSSTGKPYHITTQTVVFFPRKLVTLGSGKHSVESIPVTFREEIEPGDYTLMARRAFSSDVGNFTLESNSIRVRITK